MKHRNLEFSTITGYTGSQMAGFAGKNRGITEANLGCSFWKKLDC